MRVTHLRVPTKASTTKPWALARPPKSPVAEQRPLALVAIILGQLGVHSAMSGTRMAAPLEALRAGQGAPAAGALIAMFALAPMVMALPAGRLADRHGYHRPMRIAIALTTLGSVIAALAAFVGGLAHFVALAVAALLCGTGANVGVIATQRTAGRSATSSVERMRVFSWLGMAPALGNAVGPVVAGVAIDLAGFAWSYAAMAVLALASLAALPHVARDAPVARPAGPRPRTWSLFQVPKFKRLLMVNWLISASWDVHSFAVPVLGHERGFNASTIGLILGTFTLAVTAVRIVIPALASRLEEVRVVRVSMIGTGLVYAIYPLMPGPWSMAACAVVLGILLGSAQPMILSTLMRLTPAERHGEALALRSMAINASSAGMPVLYGFLGAVTGASPIFWVMGAMVGAGNLLARRLRADVLEADSAGRRRR
jgi:MFS family permease